jgi:small subunit ribosomal protein S4
VPSELSAKIVALPTSDQVPFDVNTNLIVEFYR